MKRVLVASGISILIVGLYGCSQGWLGTSIGFSIAGVLALWFIGTSFK